MSKVKQKLYEFNEKGDLYFKPGRKAWGVDIPAYAYDIWMPLIGLRAIAVYGLIWRLAREGQTSGMGLKKLAKRARMGDRAMSDDLTLLERCGFIEIEIGDKTNSNIYTVLDIPTVIPAALLNDPTLLPAGGYQPLCPWLMKETSLSSNGDRVSSNEDRVSPSKDRESSDDDSPSSDEDDIIESSVTPSVNSSIDIGRAAPKGDLPSAKDEKDELAGLDLSVLNPKKNQQEGSKPLSAPAEVFDHELVKLFMETTGLISLTGELRKALTDDIKYSTEDGAKATLRGGLIVLWDKLPGFENFCRQRIPEMQTWDHPLTDLNMLKHLRNVNKRDGVGGFFVWRDKHPDLCRVVDTTRAAEEKAAEYARNLAASERLAQLWGD